MPRGGNSGNSDADRRHEAILARLRVLLERLISEAIIRYGERTEPRPVERDADREREEMNEENRRELERIEKEKREKEERDRIAAEKLEKLKNEVLLISSIEEHIVNNSSAHQTDQYPCTDADAEKPQLVVRRGQEFFLTLNFKNRNYDPKIDDLEIYFLTGDDPRGNKGTSSRIKLREDDKRRYMQGKKRNWGARIEKSGDKSLTIAVYPPPDAVIGVWEYGVWTVKEKTKEKFEFPSKQDFVVLLNPWCKDDQVYMEDQDLLKEYVLNQSGTCFRGSSYWITSKSWNYGHFERGILDICLDLLVRGNGGVSSKLRDPVYISRAISKIVNSNDDDGVIVGKWGGPYDDDEGSVSPGTWSGSPAILKQFRDTKKPVKYGQCWVFSHVYTTVARALGLPCRSVTNYASAHDTDGSMTIDKVLNEDGEEVNITSDSVWNYHLWNEVWMCRPDLDRTFNVSGKYDGWHAVDATPQEMSDGVFQCGPSPLTAIKLGEVEVGYDTKFIFAEVNSDRCTWKLPFPPTLVSRTTNNVGQRISTKYPDGSEYKEYEEGFSGSGEKKIRLDVTNLYKAAEGSAAERIAVERAVGQGCFAEDLQVDTGISLSIPKMPTPTAGEDFVVKVKVENKADAPRVVKKLVVFIRPASYKGVCIGKEKIVIGRWEKQTIPAGGSSEYEVTTKARRYMDLCDDSQCMRVLCMAYVTDFDDQPVLLDEDITCETAGLELKGPNKVKRGDMCDVKVTYKNPLDVPLTKCQLKVDGSIFLDNKDFKLLNDAIYVKNMEDLAPGASKTVTLKVKPNPKPEKTTRRELNATLASRLFPDMTGNHSITLTE